MAWGLFFLDSNFFMYNLLLALSALQFIINLLSNFKWCFFNAAVYPSILLLAMARLLDIDKKAIDFIPQFIKCSVPAKALSKSLLVTFGAIVL